MPDQTRNGFAIGSAKIAESHHLPRHEFHSCVNITINFRQPRCPLDFGSGGMESRQSRRFLLKPIEETAQCIVTIPD